ncbi:uncharacterized protein LOC107222163 [Neodiprion lecontei]|uniref:Uncharacterized protein LOC107222163 n=1 Tax=Neodiprion lecontei TaxID=441921 RepID=A0ABM3G9K8_NEOLC|nr:uncharacterized protein LOC107222163 [Neodiprion lecontei]
MHRVLSFQMGRGFGESSEFVTKRMCFSFIFFFGFLALLGGFLLGRFSAERTEKLREQRKQIEYTENRMESVRLERTLLEELRKASFDQYHVTKTLAKDANEDHINHESVETTLSNSHLFPNSMPDKTVVASLPGLRESDRWVVLSVSGDGVILALELARVFEKLRDAHNWNPRRRIVFCFSNEFGRDSCRDNLPKYAHHKIVAYLTVHGNAIQKNGCFVAPGSDVVRSSVFEAVQTVQDTISAQDLTSTRRIFNWCQKEPDDGLFLPRLPSDIPHASLALLAATNISVNADYETATPYRRSFFQIIGLTIWRLSNSPILHWDPKYFERDVKAALKMIDSPGFVQVKEKITSTVHKIVNRAYNLNRNINEIEEPDSLSARVMNDLVMDLDRVLLCPDGRVTSKFSECPVNE